MYELHGAARGKDVRDNLEGRRVIFPSTPHAASK
jgi:hypothetical protein